MNSDQSTQDEAEVVDNASEEQSESQLVSDILRDKDVAFEFQKRKHPHWNENYMLYRDTLITNRLTQRQSINLPIMAETIATWLSKVDEPPLIDFKPKDSKNNDEVRKAIYWNSIWEDYYEKWKLDEVDEVDKKIVGLQGRSFKKLYWSDNDIHLKIVDPFDVAIDPKADPLNIETAMFIYHLNIFVPLNEVLANKNYNSEALNSLRSMLSSKRDLIVNADNEVARQHQQDRLRALGVYNFQDFNSSDIIIELNECYKKIWHEDEQKYEWHYIILAANNSILYNKPLEEALGIDELNWVSWAEDPDLNDMWSDSKADRVRPLNKVMNTWLSQLIENRTFRNFSMYFYDSTNPKYKPKSFEPQPFGMYPLPGKPADVLQPMPVQPLTDSMSELNYFRTMIEGVSAITSTEKGQAKQEGDRTLGEIQIDLNESTTRTTSKSKYYKNAWILLANKFRMILEANKTGNYDLEKEDSEGNIITKKIPASATRSSKGFKVVAQFKADTDSKNTDDMKKIMLTQKVFENNSFVMTKTREQMLHILGWSPEDIKQAMDAENSNSGQPAPMDPSMAGMPPIQPNINPQGALPVAQQ